MLSSRSWIAGVGVLVVGCGIASESTSGDANVGREVVLYDDFMPDAENLQEARAQSLVASFELDDGRVEIVRLGQADVGDYGFLAIGGGMTAAVMQYLRPEGATAAEVFVALADPETPIPDELRREHDVRAIREGRDEVRPRNLAQRDEFRTVDYVTNDCLECIS